MHRKLRRRWILIAPGLGATLGALAAADAGAPASAPRSPSLAEYISAICSRAFSSSSPAEAPFLALHARAMTKMLVGMEIRPSGNVDRDFATMMIPHHQGAIDMALAELRYGHNVLLRRIAQELVVEQQQEIIAMRLALGEAVPATIAAPDLPPPEPSTRPTDSKE